MAADGSARLAQASRVLLRRAAVRAGESVAITSDPRSDRRVVDAIFDAAREAGAAPMSVTVAGTGTDRFGEPPDMFRDALKSADAVISVARFSSYTKAYREILASTRVLGFSIPPSARQFAAWMLDVDYPRMDRLSDAVTKLLYDTTEFRMRSAGGTDITMRLGDRHIADDPGVVAKRGDENYLPGACVCFAPLERSWNGVLVFDGLVYPPIGLLSDPLRITVKDGRVTDIAGRPARRFRAWLEGFSDANMFRMSHIGIGLNAQFKRFTGVKSLDERIYGVLGAALGTNDIPVFEGVIRAKGHTDGYMRRASAYLDGVPLIEEGRFVHPRVRRIAGEMEAGR